jgi:hypothetical protein
MIRRSVPPGGTFGGATADFSDGVELCFAPMRQAGEQAKPETTNENDADLLCPEVRFKPSKKILGAAD